MIREGGAHGFDSVGAAGMRARGCLWGGIGHDITIKHEAC